MIGSRQGWLEVPYAACPAGFEEIAAGMRKVTWNGGTAWIAPGLTCRDEAGIPDVMRGEEVQILGVLDRLGPGAHTVCLPGTHSKWVEVTDGRIARFTTHMTGEAFAVFKAHSILGKMMNDGATDAAAFEDGGAARRTPAALLHHLFGVRARGLFGELTKPLRLRISPVCLSAMRSGRPTAGGVRCTCCAARSSRRSTVLPSPCWESKPRLSPIP
jgi:2-dehydro-3-deoxygalactonokinase